MNLFSHPRNYVLSPRRMNSIPKRSRNNSISKQSSIFSLTFTFFQWRRKETLTSDTKAVKNEKIASDTNNHHLELSARQLQKADTSMIETFSALLDQGWGNVNISMFPQKTEGVITDKRSGCPLILISGTEKQEQWFLWKAITGKEYIGSPKKPNDSTLDDNNDDFARLIGLSGFHFIVQKVGKYHEIMGKEKHKCLNVGIVSDWTSVIPSTLIKKIANNRFENEIGKSATVYRLIFWSPDQRYVLTGNHRFVIFCHDNEADITGNDHVQVPHNKIEIRSPTPRMERTMSPPLMIIPNRNIGGRERIESGDIKKTFPGKDQFFSKDESKSIDIVSVKLLRLTDSKLLESFIPWKTIGDGNCLFRAISIAAYNDEKRHVQLRWQVFQEIRDNPTWYDKDDPSYCSPFANDLGIHLENYSYYFVSTPKDGVWSDINHILATSAVLNTPIMSYFPSVLSTVSSFSRVLIGRNVPRPDDMDVKIKIMWTSTEFPKKIENFIPNHFVPLIPRKKNEFRPVFQNAWESNRDEISESINHEISCFDEDNVKKENQFGMKDAFKALGFSIFGIIGFCVLFAVPWTTIPRTNSIIYQSHWMEVLLPTSTACIVSAGSILFDLRFWTKEKALMSLGIYLKMYFMMVTTCTILYIACYVFWTILLHFNHPFPHLGFVILPTWILLMFELWLILPSKLLLKQEFRRKLRFYMLYFVWFEMMGIQNEGLSYLFANAPAGLQFLVPFLVAGCHKLDMKVRVRILFKMMGEQDGPAMALLTTNVNVLYAGFITVRLVGAEWSTICSSVVIGFVIHLRLTYQIINGYKKISDNGLESDITENKMLVTKLIIVELIEGFTPIIHGTCIAMAYYGPNAHLFSNVGSNYWGKELTDIFPFFITMSILFSVDTMSVIINALWLWKAANVNLLKEICRVLNKHWFIIAFPLGLSMSLYFATTDINLGIDGTHAYIWRTNEGRMFLIHNSSCLTDDEKSMFPTNTTSI